MFMLNIEMEMREYSISVYQMNCHFIKSFIVFVFVFRILIGQPSEENGIESIIDTTKQIGDGSADGCDINQKITATNQPTQLSIATVSAANIETQHQQQVHFKIKKSNTPILYSMSCIVLLNDFINIWNIELLHVWYAIRMKSHFDLFWKNKAISFT